MFPKLTFLFCTFGSPLCRTSFSFSCKILQTEASFDDSTANTFDVTYNSDPCQCIKQSQHKFQFKGIIAFRSQLETSIFIHIYFVFMTLCKNKQNQKEKQIKKGFVIHQFLIQFELMTSKIIVIFYYFDQKFHKILVIFFYIRWIL